MTAYCATPATLRLENTDATGNVTSSLDLMDAAGSYRVESLELAWPAVREVVAALPTRDGQWDTTALFGPRVVTVVGTILTAGGMSRQGALNTLAWWAQPALRPRLVFAVDPGQEPRRVGLRGSQLAAPFTIPSLSAFTVSWVADDPAAYDMNAQTVTVTPGVSTAGRSYPLVYPRVYGYVGPGGTAAVVSNGSYQTWPVFKIFGPCTNPAINYVGIPPQIVTSGMTVAAGDYVQIDTRAATVLYNNQPGASRYDEIDFANTVWAPFQPGTTTVHFTVATSSAPCHLEVDWSDAYLT